MRGQTRPPNHVGLRALDAVVRLGDLSAAAREMGITPAAISHRIRDLEDEAGKKLIRREAGRFVATEAGQAVLVALGDAFARIRRADTVLRGLAMQPQIRIVAPMSFTVLWLLPRLSQFEALHPDVTTYLAAASDPLRREGEADIRICHGTSPPAGPWVRIAQDATAVAGMPGTAFPDTASAVLAGRVIHIDTPQGKQGGTFGWADWAAAQGMEPGLANGPHVNAEHVAADLAMQGKGLMLASLFTLADAVQSGRLVVMPDTAVRTGISYWMLVEEPGPIARAFADWLVDAASQHEAKVMARACV